MIREPKPGRVLTERETMLLGIVRECTEAALPVPSIDDISERLGVANGGTVPELFRRLHDMGVIINKPFQRGRQVCLVETGKWSAAPMSTAPHWRDRPRDVPTPAPVVVKVRRPDIAAEIFTEAARLGKPAVEYLADLVFVGWEIEKSRG